MQSPSILIVWDPEKVPDLPCVARVNGFDESDEAAAREALGEKFPKLIYHAIACIGALIAERVEGVWIVLIGLLCMKTKHPPERKRIAHERLVAAEATFDENYAGRGVRA